MSGVTDFASLLAACVGLHFAHDSASFWLAALIGVALACGLLVGLLALPDARD